MIPARLTFAGIVAFWLAMNFLLWQKEFGVHAGDIPVPPELVWKKILTAPESSSLSVFQKQERMGYAEFSTSVGQQMAALDEDKLPPEGLVKQAGYQVHVGGNVALGGFTNRLKFDGRVQFADERHWQEFTLKIILRSTLIELHSAATNQTLHVRVVGEELNFERDLTFNELKNPQALIRELAGNTGEYFMGALDLPGFTGASDVPVPWDAQRTRVKFGHEWIPIYRLQAGPVGWQVRVDVSTLGEILQVELPGGITAHIDDWSNKS